MGPLVGIVHQDTHGPQVENYRMDKPLNHRIEYSNYTGRWVAVSSDNPQIQAWHKNKLAAIGLLKMRVEAHKQYYWMLNAITPEEYKLGDVAIDQITDDLSPKQMMSMINRCKLKDQPRDLVVDLLKAVDLKIQHRESLDFSWYLPWLELIKFLDPHALLRWPEPDWSLIDSAPVGDARWEGLES